MTKRRFIILVLAAVVVAGGVTVAVLARGDRLHAKPRRDWKDQAIANIQRRLNNPQELQSVVDAMRNTCATTRPGRGAWIGDDLLMMKNREWIAYESICSKENWRIHDLFIGRGSDGRWYYSTFHFCIGMTVLRSIEDWQPETLAQFTDAYLLVPFDGRSDECLKATWTGAQPYGLDKVRMAEMAVPVQ